MPIIGIRFEGQTGNRMLQYLHARAYAQQHGCDFYTPDWVGRKIFDLPEQIQTHELTTAQDHELNDRTDITINGYALHQKCMIYTREQARCWLKFKPEVEEKLRAMPPFSPYIFHLRRGDYKWSDFILVSAESYIQAARFYGYNPGEFSVIEEALYEFRPQPFSHELSFLPDFWRLMQAEVLFRSNSTFPWMAALLGNPKVYSPDLTGMKRGIERVHVGIPQLVPFVEGNWPAIATHTPDCTDLHLPT